MLTKEEILLKIRDGEALRWLPYLDCFHLLSKEECGDDGAPLSRFLFLGKTHTDVMCKDGIGFWMVINQLVEEGELIENEFEGENGTITEYLLT